jgi:hypothetical protein
MAVVVLSLIEINERIKAKRKKEDCPQPKGTGNESCSECALIDVCEKEEKNTP